MKTLFISVVFFASAFADCYFNQSQVVACSNPLSCGWTVARNWICDVNSYPQGGESANITAAGNYYISLLNSLPLSIGNLVIGSGVETNMEQRVTFANTRISTPKVTINTEGVLDIDLFSQAFSSQMIEISVGAELLWRSGRLNVSSIVNNGDITVDTFSSNYTINIPFNLTIDGNVTNSGTFYILNSSVIVKDHFKLIETPVQPSQLSGSGNLTTPYFYWYSGYIINALNVPGKFVVTVSQFFHMFGENADRTLIGSKLVLYTGVLLGTLQMNTGAVIAIFPSSTTGIYFRDFSVTSQDQTAIIHSFGRCFGILNLQGLLRITGQLGASIPQDTNFYGNEVAVSTIQVNNLQMDPGSILNINIFDTDVHTKIVAGNAVINNASLTFTFNSSFVPDDSTLIEFLQFDTFTGNFSAVNFIGWEKPNKCDKYLEYRESGKMFVLAFKGCASSIHSPESQFDKKTVIIIGAVVGCLCVLVSIAAAFKRLQHWCRDSKFFTFKTLKEDKY